MDSKSRSVRRALAIANSFEALYRASLFCLLPFIPLYLRHLGIGAEAMGVISAARTLLALGLAPLLSRCWAGSASGLRIGMVVFLLVAVAATLSLTAIKPDGYGDEARLKNNPYGGDARVEGCATGWKLVVEPVSELRPIGRMPPAGPTAFANTTTGSGGGSSSIAAATTTPRLNATAWTSNGTRWVSTTAPTSTVANTTTDTATDTSVPTATAITATHAAAANDTHQPHQSHQQQQQPGVNASEPTNATPVTPATARVNLQLSRGLALLREALSREPALPYALLAASTAAVCLATVQLLSRDSLRSYLGKRAAAAALDGGASAAVAALTPASWPRHAGGLGRRAGYVAAAAAALGASAAVAHLDCVTALGMSRLTVHFYVFALGCSLAMLPALFYPAASSSKSSSSPLSPSAQSSSASPASSSSAAKIAHPEKSSRRPPGGAVASRERVRGAAYLAAAFASGVGAAAVDNFLFWHLEELGATQLLLGSCVAASCLAKAAFFTSRCSRASDDDEEPPARSRACRAPCSPRVPPGVSAFLALASGAGQLAAFSFVSPAPWLALPAQLLSVLGGPALRGSSMRHSERSQVGVGPGAGEGHLGPEGVAWVVGRDRLFALCHGLGFAAGGLASGLVVARLGYAVLFRACAVGTAGCAALFGLVQLLCRKPRVRYSHLLARTAKEEEEEDDDEFAYSEGDSESEGDSSRKKLLPGTDA